MSRRAVIVLFALFAGALALRPQVIGVGPLLPEVEEDLGVSHAVAGLLGTIPVLCMGVFAPGGPHLLSRLGTRWAVASCLALIAVFGVARAVFPTAAGVVLLTFGVGLGMGLLGSMLPIAVKERFSARPAFATGVYALGINVGAGVSAALAVPLADELSGWRGTLLAFSLFTAIIVGIWLVSTSREPAYTRAAVKLGPRPASLPWGAPIAWLLVSIFLLMAVLYYGFNTWLPDAYVERGWSEERAGALIAVSTLVAIPATIVFSWLADHVGTRRLYLTGGSAVTAGALIGVVLVPDAGFLWAVLFGVAAGLIFPLLMTLPLDIADDPASVGAAAAMMLGVGYSLGALSPFLLGVARDATGSFVTSLWLLVAAAIGVTSLCLLLSDRRLRRGIRTTSQDDAPIVAAEPT